MNKSDEKDVKEKTQKDKNKKYIWNLKDIYTKDEDFYKNLEDTENIAKEIAKLEGKLHEKQVLLKYFDLSEQLERIYSKLGAYTLLFSSIDMDSEDVKKMSSYLDIVDDRNSERLMFATSELSQIDDETLLKYSKDLDFKNYKLFFEKLIEEKKHILPKEIEQIVDYASAGKEELYSVYNFLTELEMPFDEAVDSKGDKYPVTNSLYSSYLESKDEKLRKTAMFSRNEAFKKMNNTLSSTYIGMLKSYAKMIKYRKYDSYLESKLKNEDLNLNVYSTLMNGVEENIDILTKYRKLTHKIFKKMGITKDGTRSKPWDMYLQPFEKTQEKVEYEEAKEIVLRGLELLGNEYISRLEHIFDNRYIDVFPRKGKESGGYNLDLYDIHPYILLNYEGTYGDITTIAHELGHAMHGILASENQDFVLSGYNIMLAETASTTNEVIMADYLILNEKDKYKKAQKLMNFIDTIIATLITQAMFGRFEENAFKMAENEEILTPEVLNNLYDELFKKYNPTIYKDEDKENETDEDKEDINKINEFRKYTWTRIPHFYRPFYVYKYSIGITSAINIYLNILEKGDQYLEKYFNMLKSGGSKKVLDTFKIAEVDLEDKKTYDNAFKFLNEKIYELEKIIDEI